LELVVIRCSYRKHCAGEVVPGVPGLYQFRACARAQGCHHTVDALGDHYESCSGIEQYLGLTHGYLAAANDNRAATLQFEKYGILGHDNNILYTEAAAGNNKIVIFDKEKVWNRQGFV